MLQAAFSQVEAYSKSKDCEVVGCARPPHAGTKGAAQKACFVERERGRRARCWLVAAPRLNICNLLGSGSCWMTDSLAPLSYYHANERPGDTALR